MAAIIHCKRRMKWRTEGLIDCWPKVPAHIQEPSGIPNWDSKLQLLAVLWKCSTMRRDQRKKINRFICFTSQCKESTVAANSPTKKKYGRMATGLQPTAYSLQGFREFLFCFTISRRGCFTTVLKDANKETSMAFEKLSLCTGLKFWVTSFILYYNSINFQMGKIPLLKFII